MHRMLHEVHCRATPGNKLHGTHLCAKGETATVKCLVQQQNVMNLDAPQAQHKKTIRTAQLNCAYCMFNKKIPCCPFVCSVIQHHRWHQNVVRTKKWRWQSVSLMFLQHFDAICDLLLMKHMATLNSISFIIIIKKQTTTQKSFFIPKSFNI